MRIESVPIYVYTALDNAEHRINGTLIADTPSAARRHLRQQGLSVTAFYETGSRRRPGWAACPWGRKRRQVMTAEWVRHLAMLLRTGVPLAEAMDVLIAQSRKKGETVLRDLREQVSAGLSLAEAMEHHPAWFDALCISSVRVGQASGNLDEALAELAEFLNERQTLQSKLTAALAYPALLSTLGIGVVLFLMTFVMPQLLGVLTASGKQLPASTVFLKTLSDGLVRHGWLLGIAAAVIAAVLAAAVRTERGRLTWHRLKLRSPLVGPLVAKATVAQFAQVSVMLLKAGVPFVEAMATTRQCISNRVLAGEIDRIRSAVEAGGDIAPALSTSRVFPPLVVHLVAVGQASGELTEMLEQVRKGYETEVRLAIGKFTAALEPLLIVILAALIGFIVFATMMPILEATRVMG